MTTRPGQVTTGVSGGERKQTSGDALTDKPPIGDTELVAPTYPHT